MQCEENRAISFRRGWTGLVQKQLKSGTYLCFILHCYLMEYELKLWYWEILVNFSFSNHKTSAEKRTLKKTK